MRVGVAEGLLCLTAGSAGVGESPGTEPHRRKSAAGMPAGTEGA